MWALRVNLEHLGVARSQTPIMRLCVQPATRDFNMMRWPQTERSEQKQYTCRKLHVSHILSVASFVDCPSGLLPIHRYASR
jgi:hypothetical protein